MSVVVLARSFRMVFSNKAYVALAAAIAGSFWIVLATFDQLLFFSPVVVFYLPSDATITFTLSNIMAGTAGIVVSMNVYVLRHSRLKLGTSLFSGSAAGVVSSACAGCSSFGFLLVTTFGGAGAAASTFLSVYQVPLRLISIGLLLWSYYSVHNRLTKSCIMTDGHNR